MIELAVLADDLTGGMMIASFLEANGVVCPLVTDPAALSALPPAAEAVVLARKLRFAPAAQARAEARTAAAAFQRIGARRIYQKYCATFDSTPEGNIGPIAEELLAATGAPRTLFCPAFVEWTVTVYQGHLFIGRTPMGESLKRFDPVCPMTSSDLVALLAAQTQHRVGLLPRQALANPAFPDAPFLIADATDTTDVANLAALCADWPLITGGDSLAPALARHWRAGRPPAAGAGRRLLPAAPGPAAILCGSCHPHTLDQIAAFPGPVRRIDLAAEGDRPALAAELIAWATKLLAAGPVCIATSADQAGVAAAQARFGREGAAAHADALLAAVAAGLHAAGVRKFIVAGGETSGAVLGAIGVTRASVSAFDDLMGGYFHASAAGAAGHATGSAPIAGVIKAGSAGGPDFFARALARLAEADGDTA